MKTRLFIPVLAFSLLFAPMALQGCYGHFALTTKLLKWNGTVGDRWINSIVMWALIIVPVYPIASAVDFLVLNTVEFWSGTNPAAMNPGESETRVVTIQGREFKVTATRNHMNIVPTGAGEPVTLAFDPDSHAWYMETLGEKRKIAEQGEDVLTLLHPDGHREIISR